MEMKFSIRLSQGISFHNLPPYFFLQFKKQGTLCRGVKTDCDVPEYCTGGSRDVSIVLSMLFIVHFFKMINHEFSF